MFQLAARELFNSQCFPLVFGESKTWGSAANSKTPGDAGCAQGAPGVFLFLVNGNNSYQSLALFMLIVSSYAGKLMGRMRNIYNILTDHELSQFIMTQNLVGSFCLNPRSRCCFRSPVCGRRPSRASRDRSARLGSSLAAGAWGGRPARCTPSTYNTWT